MKVDISDIIRINGASLKLEFEEIPINGRELAEGYIIDCPVGFTGALTNMGGGILELDGRLKASYKTACYRCLKEIGGHIDIKINDCFANGTKTAEEMDAYCFEGKLIDLDKVLEDNIILNLPMKEVCSAQCRGLCQICGTNLNEAPCSCRVDSVNPQMEALDNFF